MAKKINFVPKDKKLDKDYEKQKQKLAKIRLRNTETPTDRKEFEAYKRERGLCG